MRPLLLCLLVVLALAPFRPAEAAEPFFKKGDVIALVGGEDMVVASEYGYLELLLTRALPDYHLRFRNLAWEGDTVFEQRRDLNFPSYEEQLDKIGATVVIAQFGQMESLAGKEKLPEFIAAYEKLIERFSGGGKRRVVLVETSPYGDLAQPVTPSQAKERMDKPLPPDVEMRASYAVAIQEMAEKHGYVSPVLLPNYSLDDKERFSVTRDGIHLNQLGQRRVGNILGSALVFPPRITEPEKNRLIRIWKEMESDSPLRQLIIAKNRLWFDYWRPQNWAFLAGDRTAQPSSRDHLDPSKRWFPPEREAFLPLLEAKEKEIDALAAQLAAGNAGK